MEKEPVEKALAELKKQPPRKFVQSYDLIVNLKDIEIKTNPIDFFVTLSYPPGKKVKVAALVDRELVEQADKFCDLTLREADFLKYKEDQKAVKKLAEQYDFFIAQINLMPKVAAVFGKVLGTRGRMPTPKLGCVVPPNTDLGALVKKLNLTVRLTTKKGTNLQCIVGKENQPDSEIIENILTVYQAVIKHLPDEKNNVKNVLLKLTMGPPVKL